MSGEAQIYQAFGYDCSPSYLGLIGCWGAGLAAGIKHRLLIAEDHSFTFKTTDQRYDPNCRLPYGPVVPKATHAN